MRQAGRYMPEYRAIREKHAFEEMCRTPEIAAEVTLLPIRRFSPDAAIVFSDILVLLESLGTSYRIEEKKGPVIENPLQKEEDLQRLQPRPVEETIGYVAEAMRILKRELEVPLLGFCGAPFTLASYLIEGGSSRDLARTKQWLFQKPESFHNLLELLTRQAIAHLQMQIDAGADAVQVFDSWAGLLPYRQFEAFSLRYLKRIVDAVKHRAPVIVFCRGSSSYAAMMGEIGPSCVSLDWQCALPSMRASLPAQVALQGNLDPTLLLTTPETIRREVNELLAQMKNDPGFIFNLGHGVLPGTPPENVQTLIEAVKNG